jgi:hypothetical protein
MVSTSVVWVFKKIISKEKISRTVFDIGKFILEVLKFSI